MKRHTISIAADTHAKLVELQQAFKEKFGLSLTITQVIDFLVKQYGGNNGNN
jgi:sulfur relay (sulfurtransferase) DsrC/TusE family protein